MLDITLSWIAASATEDVRGGAAKCIAEREARWARWHVGRRSRERWELRGGAAICIAEREVHDGTSVSNVGVGRGSGGSAGTRQYIR